MKFAEMLFAQSGGISEANRFARPCEVSRTTISNYLSVLEATFVVHVIAHTVPLKLFRRQRCTPLIQDLFAIIANGLSYGRKIKAICGSIPS